MVPIKKYFRINKYKQQNALARNLVTQASNNWRNCQLGSCDIGTGPEGGDIQMQWNPNLGHQSQPYMCECAAIHADVQGPHSIEHDVRICTGTTSLV